MWISTFVSFATSSSRLILPCVLDGGEVALCVGYCWFLHNGRQSIQNRRSVLDNLSVFDVLPEEPVAAARTDLCASSFDSALKAVVASCLIVVASVVVAKLFKLEETVLASFAKFETAVLTLAEDTLVLEVALVASVLISSTTVFVKFVEAEPTVARVLTWVIGYARTPEVESKKRT